ncbi:MAG: hypothetical protein ABSG84_10555 [Acidobacteriaceae bacterium]|jgi:sphingomyelin phosphodiesterase acid-like 3
MSWIANPQLTLFLLFALLSPTPLAAQPAGQPAQSAATIPALFLSDIHLDPYHDPAKVAKLNAAPASDWPAILAQPDAPTQPADFAALQTACGGRGNDTSNLLWRSSLAAIHARASRVRFATLSGDLLAHQFDCRFKVLLPSATHADYLVFAEKTVGYIVSTLREALPGVPIYISLGNDDTGCSDYQLSPTRDEFLANIAPIIASSLPADLSQTDRDAALRDFAAGGYYTVPLTSTAHTRILVLDDVFLSSSYATCAGRPDPAPAAAQLAWLQTQLAAAHQQHQQVWVLGHIPPGVNLYATARRAPNLCAGGKPQMFLGSEGLAEILSSYPDIVRLALFGHTHSDEMHLLMSPPLSLQGAEDIGKDLKGTIPPNLPPQPAIPLKITASITPVNGNRPTFTLASVDPSSATLIDYTVIMASNLTGVAATWSPEYTYSAVYHQATFDAAALAALISGFQADPGAKSAASQAYIRNYFPGDISPILTLAWPQYACSMDHNSDQSFTACACAAAK